MFRVYLNHYNQIALSFSGVDFSAGYEDDLPLNNWTLVTVYIFAFDTGREVLAQGVVSYNDTIVSPTVASSEMKITTLQLDDPSDIFTIGGFIGLMSSLKIIYRGSGQSVDGKLLSHNHYLFTKDHVFLIASLQRD